MESQHDCGLQDEGPGEIQSQDGHIKVESEGDPKKGSVREFVVKKLQETSTRQLKGYAFCDIIAILSYHNHSLYKDPKEPEDPHVALYLAMVAVAIMFHHPLELFMVIGVL